MKSNRNSPFTTSFNSSIQRGIPCGTAVQQISKRTGKSVSVIFQSLWNAGACNRQKVNGQWIYWPVNGKKSTSSYTKQCQVKMWQNFIDWCVASGTCTSKQLKTWSASPTKFFSFLNTCFNKMNGSSWTGSKLNSSFAFSSSSSTTKRANKTASKKNTKKRTTKTKSRKNTWARSSKTTKSYRFPTLKARKNTNSRKFRQAA